MTSNPTHGWMEGHQRYLMASLALIHRRLERCARSHSDALRDVTPGQAPSDDDRAIRAAQAELELARRSLEKPAPLDILCQAFGLTGFERDLLLLCAGVELNTAIADACDAMQGSPMATFGLALRALPEAAWGPLAPDSPLRRWHLVSLGSGASLASRPLRIDDYILHFLLGLQSMDERLLGFIEPVVGRRTLSPSQLAAVERAVSLWASEPSLPVLSLCGTTLRTARVAANEICARGGLQLYALHAADIPDVPAEQILAARLWERHAALTGAALLLELSRENDGDKARLFAERVQSPILIASLDPVRLRHRAAMRVDIPTPLLTEQHTLWRQALGERAEEFSSQISAIASQFQLGGDEIDAVAAELRASEHRTGDQAGDQAGDRPGVEPSDAILDHRLWHACRIQARPKLDELAQHIELRATWDDLIISQRQHEQLRELSAHVRHRARVYDGWGFAKMSSRGLGISALFAGPSGTGKTTAAEVIAGELRLDLYRIDLSSVVSKYIGETEKNLRRVFDAAEGGGAILLFDEADALFGKRSDVKDSHDRYANMEVSYLLQRMEAYRGLAILTSNLRDSLDSAFMRRIRFVVEFPFPSQDQRRAIWQRMFPPNAPVGELLFDKLARLKISGGNIRNVAMQGAFLAAEQDCSIEMRHLRVAARAELAKLERTIPERELKDWI